MVPSTIQVEPESLGFDEVLDRLRTLVSQLEDGNLSLEASLQVYEEGVRLARRGHSVLDQAEKRVELLVRESRGDAAGEDGQPETVPFDEEDPDTGTRGTHSTQGQTRS